MSLPISTSSNQAKPIMFSVKDLLHTLKPAAETTPFTGKRVHFIGIGGSGMSGLAQMLMTFGAKVSGTDRTPSPVTHRLSEGGVAIKYEQVAASIPEGTEWVVYSAAVRADHPEMVEAQTRGCRILKYAQMLGEVMNLKRGIAIAGTHGKSTTTAMTSHVLLSAGKDPSFVIGATVPQLGGSSRSGKGEYFVVEACEYDRSFHNLRPRFGIVLNIEEDHLDYYKNIDEINESFAKFLGQVDPAGVILVAAGDPNCTVAAKHAEAMVETYGIDVPADWQATGIRRFQGKAHFNVTYKGKKMGRLALSVAGRHNVGNAMVAAAIATHCGVPWTSVQSAIETFQGADRRSQLLLQMPLPGQDGEPVSIVDDYAHHPTELKATITALKEHYRPTRLVCVFQPHQHSRTRMLLEEFSQSFGAADVTIIPDIYFARDSEADCKAVNGKILADKISAVIASEGGSGEAHYIPTFAEVQQYLMDQMKPGDLIVSMGAGPVWEITHELVRRLRGTGPA